MTDDEEQDDNGQEAEPQQESKEDKPSCGNCGAELKEGQARCVMCDTKLDKSAYK